MQAPSPNTLSAVFSCFFHPLPTQTQISTFAFLIVQIHFFIISFQATPSFYSTPIPAHTSNQPPLQITHHLMPHAENDSTMGDSPMTNGEQPSSQFLSVSFLIPASTYTNS